VVTDWQGRPLGTGDAGDVVAAGDARCHAEALDLLSRRHDGGSAPEPQR